MTQLGQRKLAQVRHLATALDSLLLQLVHEVDWKSMVPATAVSINPVTPKSHNKPLTPEAPRGVSAWHWGHDILSLWSWTFSRQHWQKVWKQSRTLGLVYVQPHSGHLVQRAKMEPRGDDPSPEDEEVEELDELVLSRAESRLQWSFWKKIMALNFVLLKLFNPQVPHFQQKEPIKISWTLKMFD